MKEGEQRGMTIIFNRVICNASNILALTSYKLHAAKNI